MAPLNNELLTEEEKYMLDSLKAKFVKFDAADKLNLFMLGEMLKPITLKDGRQLSEEETAPYLKEFKGKPFHEVTRNGSGGAHLTTFCFAYGMSFDDMLILKNQPDNEEYPKIKEKFENLRKDFFEMACCPDEKKRDQLVSDYYYNLMEKTVNTLEEIKRSGNFGIDNFAKFCMIADGFQSLGVQTLSIGNRHNIAANKPGLHYVDQINKKLKDNQKPYDFSNFFNTAAFSSLVTQASNSFIRDYVDYSDPENALPITRYKERIQKGALLIKGLDEFAKFMRNPKSIGETIGELTNEKAAQIQAVNMAPELEDEPSLVYAGLIINEFETTKNKEAFNANIEKFKAMVPVIRKKGLSDTYIFNPSIAKLSGFLAERGMDSASFLDDIVLKQQDAYKSLLEAYTQADDTEDYLDYEAQLKLLESSNNIPAELTNRHNEIKQIYCSQFAPQMLQAGNEIQLPENDLTAAIRFQFIKSEIEKISIRRADIISDVDFLTNQVNEELFNNVINDHENGYEHYNQLMDRLMNKSAIKAILKNPPANAAELISDSNAMEELIYGKNYLTGFSRGNLTTLYEKERKFGSGTRTNSEKYDAIKNGLLSINQQRANLEDIDVNSYMDLYNACSDYVNNRSADAKTQSGRERFAAAAELMYKLGSKIKEELPDAAAKIDRDFKLTCIRSKVFRENLIASTNDDNLREFATVTGSTLNEKTKKGMEPDVIKTDARANEILTKAQQLVEKDRLIKNNRGPVNAFNDMSQAAKAQILFQQVEANTPQKTGFIAEQISIIVFAQECIQRSQTKDLNVYLDTANMEPMLERIKPFATQLVNKLGDKSITKLLSDEKGPERLTKEIEKSIKKTTKENIFEAPETGPERQSIQNVL